MTVSLLVCPLEPIRHRGVTLCWNQSSPTPDGVHSNNMVTRCMAGLFFWGRKEGKGGRAGGNLTRSGQEDSVQN